MDSRPYIRNSELIRSSLDKGSSEYSVEVTGEGSSEEQPLEVEESDTLTSEEGKRYVPTRFPVKHCNVGQREFC